MSHKHIFAQQKTFPKHFRDNVILIIILLKVKSLNIFLCYSPRSIFSHLFSDLDKIKEDLNFQTENFSDKK